MKITRNGMEMRILGKLALVLPQLLLHNIMVSANLESQGRYKEFNTGHS